MALMLALIDRQRTDRGQVVDVGMHDCLAVSAELANPYWFYPRVVVHRQTCRHAQPTPTAPALFECGDGRYVYFVLFVADLKPFRALVDWMATLGVEADLNEPQYEDAAYRQANFGHIQGLVEVFFLLQPAAEAYHEGQARGLPIGVAYAPDDLFGDEHLRARDFFVTVEHDDVPPAEYPGAPIRFSAYDPVAMSRAPRLGEHTDEVLGRIDVTSAGGGDRA
jgi:benzylsuccinate CoA-transferase BbsE subunit